MPRERQPFTRKIAPNASEVVINLPDMWRNPDEVREVLKNINKFRRQIK